MDPTLSPRRFVALAVAAGLLQGCGPAPRTQEEEGVYGASSGPNPNLRDLQEEQAKAPNPTPAAPASPEASTYPSQGVEAPPATGPEGGRRSAQTGASPETTP